MERTICPETTARKVDLLLCASEWNGSITDRESEMSLGARLTELRLKKNESLQNVASAVGASKVHIWELEKGKTENPSMTLVKRLADHFGLSVASLMGEDPAASGVDPQLGRMFRQAKDLQPDDVAILDDLMQSLLKRRGQRP